MKAWLVFALAAFVALVAACAAPYGGHTDKQEPEPPNSCDRTFIASPEFTRAERIGLERAVDRWNRIAIEQFCVRSATDAEAGNGVLTPGLSHAIYRIPYKGERWKQLSDGAGGADILGIYFGDDDHIEIVDGLADDGFEIVALHELGHAHGLNHTDAPSIMHASIGTATDFTANDTAECQRVGACNKEDEDG